MINDYAQPEPEPKRKFSLSGKAIVILSIIVVVALFLCVGGIAAASYLMGAPLGPALEIPTEIPTAVIEPTQAPPLAAAPTSAPPASAIPTAAPTTTPQPVTTCNQSGAMNILILGVEPPVPSFPRGPLAIRMLKLDFGQKTAVVFTFPRDLSVSVTGLEGLGINQTTLGQAYLKAMSQGGYSETAAINLLATALSNNFSARADHYVMIKLANLSLLIDSLGGVDVNVSPAFDGRSMRLPYFSAGYNHMTGSQAITYGVSSSALDQWNAANRQNQVFQALGLKVLSPNILPSVPALVTQFFMIVTTDFSPQQILDLACIGQSISPERITYVEVGPADVTRSADGALIPIGDSIRTKAQQYLGK